jgi:arylsulfatase A-like enzyme
VPFAAWWPAKVKGGVVNEKTVISSLDLFPTLAARCGAKVPTGYKSDGVDMSKALLGESPVRDRRLFWEYGRNDTSFAFPKGAGDRSPNVAVRDGDWKLLVNADGTGAELYDLAADRGRPRVEEGAPVTRQRGPRGRIPCRTPSSRSGRFTTPPGTSGGSRPRRRTRASRSCTSGTR